MGRPKQFDPEAAVEQAMQVFWRQGYAATTPQDLVDALGIGKGSLYHAFGSKHALFELALRRYRDSQAVAVIELLDGEGPVKDRLRAALRMLVEMDLTDPDRRGCMAVNLSLGCSTARRRPCGRWSRRAGAPGRSRRNGTPARSGACC